jgi:hypothetical protein
MVTLSVILHESILRHGKIYVEMNVGDSSRKRGAVVECPCGKRWIGRAPWFR